MNIYVLIKLTDDADNFSLPFLSVKLNALNFQMYIAQTAAIVCFIEFYVLILIFKNIF